MSNVTSLTGYMKGEPGSRVHSPAPPSSGRVLLTSEKKGKLGLVMVIAPTGR